jgi:hypothetical protein
VRPRWTPAAIVVLVIADGISRARVDEVLDLGDTIYTVRPEPHMLQPWTGFGVFCLYAAAALAAGFVLIGRRDA